MEWRRDAKDFDYHYYRFFNALSVDNTISSGVNKDKDGILDMTINGTYSASENWLLYQQSGRYFIRNYDYKEGDQLGVESTSRTDPKLLKRSGGLAQQWTIAKTEDGKGWRLTNGLLGNDTYLGLQGKKPVMTKDTKSGTVWTIEMNESAGIPEATDLRVQNVADFEFASTTSTTSMSSTSATTSVPSTSTNSALPKSTGTDIPPSTIPSTPNDTRSSGALAGMIIGPIVGALLLAGLVWFLLARRHKKKTGGPYATMNDQIHEAYASIPVNNGNGHYEVPSPTYMHEKNSFVQELPASSVGTEYAELGAQGLPSKTHP